jgi:hypothetical protein
MAINSSGLNAITGSEDATAKLSNLATGKASVTCAIVLLVTHYFRRC